MPKVELEPCGADKRPVIEAMFQLYVHDFSDYWAGEPRGELKEDGRFEDYPGLDRYWTEPERSAWLIRRRRPPGRVRPAVGLQPFRCPGRPRHGRVLRGPKASPRRGGVRGREPVDRARKGQWEIAIARANVGALAFWRRVAAEVATGEVDEQWHDTARWNGAILRLEVA